MHPADFRSVVVDQFDIGIQLGFRVDESVSAFGCLQLTLHRTHEFKMILESLLVFTADSRGNLAQVFSYIIKKSCKGCPVLVLTVEPVQHLVGIVNRSHGLVRSGVNHPGPVVSPGWHCYPELEGSETGAGCGVFLEEVPDLLIDRDATCPPRRGV